MTPMYERSRLDAARERLIFGWVAATCPPLPDDVVDVATRWLCERPNARLEYVGRGRFRGKSPHAQTVVYLDKEGGRRSYAFRVMTAGDGRTDARLDQVGARYGEIARWLDDDAARVVLSLGGGGFRLFAAQAALRTIDRVLGGVRRKIDEVWGASGGALLGYTFAYGHELSVAEQLGYLVYHSRTNDLMGINVRTALYLANRVLRGRAFAAKTRPELGAWVDAVDRLCPPEARHADRIPFYALVSNTRWRHAVALAEPAFIPDYARDLLVACDPREATAASMAVPFFLSPLRGIIQGYETDSWYDGAIVEENPIMAPFAKWLRDRKHDPEHTPSRLKLLLINLNTRFSESKIVTALPKGRITLAADLIDLLMDSRTHSLVRTLGEVGSVEIVTATLNIGLMSFLARSEIPAMIRTGQILEGWQLDLSGLRGAGETRA
jgi:hypothetical protein